MTFKVGDMVELIPMGEFENVIAAKYFYDQEEVRQEITRVYGAQGQEPPWVWPVAEAPKDGRYASIMRFIMPAGGGTRGYCSGRFRLAQIEVPYDPTQEPDEEDDV